MRAPGRLRWPAWSSKPGSVLNLPCPQCHLPLRPAAIRPFTITVPRSRESVDPQAILDDYVTKKEIKENTLATREGKAEAERRSLADMPEMQLRGGLPPTSIFHDQGENLESLRNKITDPSGAGGERRSSTTDPYALAATLDPRPRRRQAWERREVTRLISRNGKLTPAQTTMRTERQSLCKSHWFRTSVKKLAPLAVQIAGKPIEDAIVQMRFSKKKAARDVQQHLEYARNEAIVGRGMGLGRTEGRTGTPIDIKLKDGSKWHVEDRTGIYVAEAWVGRGPYVVSMMRRARGRRDQIRHPWTSMSVILKEEASRIWESAQRRLKEEKKKPWRPLPDRPVTAQRQWCLW